MSDNTILQQGFYTATAADKILPLRSDVDWVKVYNMTNIAAATIDQACTFWWQREMAVGDAIVTWRGANSFVDYSGTLLGSTICGGLATTIPGIYLIDSSASMLGPVIAITQGTNATQPLISTATTTGLNVGTIVRYWGGLHTNTAGIDFSIDTITAATSFRIANTLATAPGVANGAGFYRIVAPNAATYKMFYPSKRVIANITAANPAVVTTTVGHGYAVGQTVKIFVPPTCGMTQINGMTATITVVTAGTFTTDIDASAFTAFNFPLPAIVPFTPAEVIPLGDLTVTGFGTTLTGATVNSGFIGLKLSYHVTIPKAGPTGAAGDVIKWVAGKSFATNLP
jgi:hypothetical protein